MTNFFCAIQTQIFRLAQNPAFYFFALALFWNVLVLWVYWPGYLTIDGVYYFDSFLLSKDPQIYTANESLLYSLLAWVSLRTFQGFQLASVVQILYGVLISTYFFSLLNSLSKKVKWVNWLPLGAVVFLPTTLTIQLTERDVLFSWSMILLFVLQARIVWLPEHRFRYIVLMGLVTALFMDLKQSGLIAPLMVLLQLWLLKIGKPLLRAYVLSVTSFSFLVLVALPLSLNLEVSHPLKYARYVFELGKSIGEKEIGKSSDLTVTEYLRVKLNQYQKARGERFYEFFHLQEALDSSISSKELFALRPNLWAYPSEGWTGAFHESVANILYEDVGGVLWNRFYLGELVLFLALVGCLYFPALGSLLVLPLVQLVVTFMFQPVGKSRYFYFLYLLPYFLVPLLVLEWVRRNREAAGK